MNFNDMDRYTREANATQNGHKVKLKYISPCIHIPICQLCGKKGWINLQKKCEP